MYNVLLYKENYKVAKKKGGKPFGWNTVYRVLSDFDLSDSDLSSDNEGENNTGANISL